MTDNNQVMIDKMMLNEDGKKNTFDLISKGLNPEEKMEKKAIEK